MEHTKTPWKYTQIEAGHYEIESINPRLCTVADTQFLPIHDQEAAANARRICAAVNATAGITTEELEFAIEENIRLDFTGRAERINKMEAEVPAINARLLDAAKRVSIYMGWDSHEMDSIETIGEFKTAIAEAETSEMKVVVPQQDGSAIEYDNMKEAQPAQVIANLTRKLGDAIKALRDIAETLMEITGGSGPVQGSVSDALETAKEALKPYEPDSPDPCDLARDYNDAVMDADQPTPYDP